ncbi:MFS transporter [Spirillospora sp. CA-255316]
MEIAHRGWDDGRAMSPHPLFRTSRAVAFAAVCVTLATLGHVLTSTAAVPLWTIAAGFGGVLAVTLALAGHERSLATILGGLLGGQFALHSLYAAATAPPLPADPAAAAAGHHAVAAVPGHESSLAMTFAHVAAAVVSAWWLRRGERAAWTLARRIAALAGRPLRVLLALLGAGPAAPAPRTPVVRAVVPAASARGILRHQVVRRGPPRRSRALALG